MDASDILFATDASTALKHAIIAIAEAQSITDPYTRVLVPTDTNDDINGSQHANGGGTDFTYRDAEPLDLARATTLGYYEHFSSEGSNYTGHYYNGDGHHFPAIVLNPPSYAITHHI